MTVRQDTPEHALAAMLNAHRLFYIGEKNELTPMYWLWRQNGEMVPCLFAELPPDPDDRDLMIAKVKDKVAELGDVYMFAFVAEGWTVPPMSEKEYRSMRVPPSESENRIEVVNTLVGHRDGTRLVDMHELVRDWKTGCVTELKSLRPARNMSAPGLLQSRFDLFK